MSQDTEIIYVYSYVWRKAGMEHHSFETEVINTKHPVLLFAERRAKHPSDNMRLLWYHMISAEESRDSKLISVLRHSLDDEGGEIWLPPSIEKGESHAES